MKKLLLTFLFANAFIGSDTFAQGATFQQKLYYTCKVWGFVKYFHSNVSNCNVNWDSVLIRVLPLVKDASNDSEFNNALDTMLVAAGPMTVSTSYFPDTIAPELKRNRNFGWIGDPIFRFDVKTILDTIKNNFRPHPNCYVIIDTASGPFGTEGGYLFFPQDVPLLNTYTTAGYIDESHRLLVLFKFWNIINYFNPYNYALDRPADSILYNSVLRIDTVSNAFYFYQEIKRISANLNDAHVEGLTYSVPYTYPGEYVPRIMLRYIEGQYVVVKTAESGVYIGDAITAINGIPIAQIEDSLKNFVSSGNISVFHRFLCDYYLLWGKHLTGVNIDLVRPSGGITNVTLTRSIYFFDAFFPKFYYPADSIASLKWTTMGCGLGYINLENSPISTADSAYAALHNSPAIIIDIRNYPQNNSAWELANLMSGGTHLFAKLMLPDVTYSGTYTWEDEETGITGTTSPYTGTVILLFNEQTQSGAEFDCMGLGSLPNVIKVGSQTAGADGNITFFRITQDIHSGFTSLGVFYPNGDSTQRLGIVPDSIVSPTIQGILQGRDEVLEKALQIGCSLTSVPQRNPNNTKFTIYPNPTTTSITIQSTNQPINQLTISNLLGQTVYTHEYNTEKVQIDVADLPKGMYLIRINGSEVRKFVKE